MKKGKRKLRKLQATVDSLAHQNRELILRVLENEAVLGNLVENFNSLLRVAVVDLTGTNDKSDIDNYFDLRFRGGVEKKGAFIGDLVTPIKEKH